MTRSEWCRGEVLIHLQISKAASTSFKAYLRRLAAKSDNLLFASENGAGPILYSRNQKVKIEEDYYNGKGRLWDYFLFVSDRLVE